MALHIDGQGRFLIEVSGESKYQAALASACGGRTFDGVSCEVLATLILEDDNPADADAVRVEIGGRPVGHLTADDAPSYRRELARAGHPGATVTCDAVIVGGWDRGDGDTGMFGVKLDLPPARSAEQLDDGPPRWLDGTRLALPRNPPPKAEQIRVVCAGCGQGIRAPDSFAGREIHCPGCGETVIFAMKRSPR